MTKPALADKSVFTTTEAAEFYNLSKPKFCKMLNEEAGLPFVAMYRKRRLIIRSEFEKFLRLHPEIKEKLGRKKSPERLFRVPDIKAEGLPAMARDQKRKSIIRLEFRKFLRSHPEVKEVVKNGRTPIPQKA